MAGSDVIPLRRYPLSTSGPAHPTIHNLLDTAIAAESQISGFYLFLSQAFDYLPNAASLFHSFMVDHSQHLATLREIRGRFTNFTLPHQTAADALSQARSILEMLSLANILAVGNLDQAYELAQRCDAAETELRVTLLATGIVPPELRDSLRHPELHVHRTMLNGLAQQLGNRDWRRTMAVRCSKSDPPHGLPVDSENEEDRLAG